MRSSDGVRFVDDPVASISGQFALCRPDPATRPAESTTVAGHIRPWGLRDLTPAEEGGAGLPSFRYDHDLQLAVLADGSRMPLASVVAAAPTAPTTTRTDGEDGPSSEDWKNDFTPDEPCPY